MMTSLRRWTVLATVATAACSGSGKRSTNGVEVLRDLQLTDEARLLDNDDAISLVEVTPERLVIHYRSTPKLPLAVGNVVAGSHGDGYLRRVTDIANRDGGAVEVATDSAVITDLIRDGHFRLSRAIAPTAWVEGDGKVAGRTAPLSVDVLPEERLLCGGKLVSPIMDFDLRNDDEFDIRLGSIQRIRVAVTGSVKMGLEIASSTDLAAECEADLIEMLREQRMNPNLLKLRFTEKFFIGVVPIVVTHTLSPVLRVKVGIRMSGGGDTRIRRFSTFSLTAGAEMVGDGPWQTVWDPSQTDTFEAPQATVTEFSGSAALDGGASYSMFLWDAIGPSIEITLGLETQISASSESCRWTATGSNNISARATGTLQIPVIAYPLAMFEVLGTRKSWPLTSAGGPLSCASDGGGGVSDAATVDGSFDAGDGAPGDAAPSDAAANADAMAIDAATAVDAACGQANQPCCGAGDCATLSLQCQQTAADPVGTCTAIPCGTPQIGVCCADHSCTANCHFVAIPGHPGSCHTLSCGGLRENCCQTSTGPSCSGGMTCVSPSYSSDGSLQARTRCDTVPCGGSGQACCAVLGGFSCGSGLTCQMTASSGWQCLATPCGGSGQNCCGYTEEASCDTGLRCQSTGGPYSCR